MTIGRFTVLGILGWLAAGWAGAAEAPLRIVTEDAPPLNFIENETVIGPATDLVRAITERAAVPIGIELLPWLRAYQQALDRPDTCVYSTAITEDRKSLFKWVGPLMQFEWVIYGRTDMAIEPHSIEDARKFILGVYHGDALQDYFEGLGGYHLVVVQDLASGIRQLSAGRIDLFGGPRGIQRLARREGANNLKELLEIQRAPVGLACNRAVPDGTIARMQAALDAMEADGTADKIRNAYNSGL